MKAQRYNALKHSLENVDGVSKIELDEDWIPPHKMAAFTPYDAIVTLEDTDTRWTKNEFESLLRESDVKFDKVISFESDGEGRHEVFMSLATAEEQGITASSD